MDLGHLTYEKGSKKKSKRIGRGIGSGHGKTSCRGSKGQKARSGSKRRSGFEGGQMPLQRRLPKRGFTNIFTQKYQVLNVGELDSIKKNQISPDELLKAKVIRYKHLPVKILGNGEVKKPLEVQAHAFSKKAVEKLEAAGGKVIRL
jgi:large subunit ribosomal protein L15